MKILKIKLPRGFMNAGITTTDYFVADTNDGADWRVLRVQLPKGKWSIKTNEGEEITLQRNTFISRFYTSLRFYF